MSEKAINKEKFGLLTPVKPTAARQSNSVVWECLCDCGSITFVCLSNLKSGNTKSCGCKRKNNAKQLFTKHGKSKSRAYKARESMIQRCTNHRNPAYKDYGGRGITICDRWLESFENFLEDMGECPDGFELDRIDVNGDYNPDNCRWADIYTQQSNKRIPANNTSGVVGVSWAKDRNKWHAQGSYFGDNISLGYFTDFNEAVKVRQNWEKEKFK